MDNLHLHHIFQEIAGRLQCPACSKKIPVQNVSILSFKGNNTLFQAECPHCGQSMNINAIVETSSAPSGKKEAISHDEIQSFSKDITHIQSFSSL